MSHVVGRSSVSGTMMIIGIRVLLLLLLFDAAAVSAASSYGSDGVISITGSGAASPCIEFLMEILQDRAKIPTRFTYREINNRTQGQMEFLESVRTGSIDFGAGHRPLPSWIYQSLQQQQGMDVLHFPYVLSPVALYHNIPGITTQLNLTSCMIAQIFKRNLKSWKNHGILEQNPLMKDMSPHAIIPLHPSSLSEITLAFTEYLHLSCPEEWPKDLVDDEISWPEGVTRCSEGMAHCISNTPYSIGFLEVAHSLPGLQEVPLQNQEGHYRTSFQSNALNGILAAVDDRKTFSVLTNVSSQDGSAEENPIYQPGPNTWPIVLLQQVYVMREWLHLSVEGQGLLLAFLRALLEPSYIGQCQTTFGLIPVPDHIRSIGLEGLDQLIQTNTQLTPWGFETDDGTLKPGDYVISERRHSYSFQNQGVVQQKLTYITNKLRTMEEEITILRKNNEYLNTAVQDLRAALQVFTFDGKVVDENQPSSSLLNQLYPQSAPALAASRESESMTNLNALDDDTPINIRTGLPIYGTVENQQLHTALILASMSFIFWSIFFVWKIWRCFLSI